MPKQYFVYILASQINGTLYIGVTNDLRRRLEEYLSGSVSSFTGKYKVNKLVYFEECNSALDAIAREKQLKNWHRLWKLNLINKTNPEWKDLTKDL